MIRKYHNHKPQTTPRHREEEPINHQESPGRQIKQSNQLSLPHQDDCNTRMDINNVQQNIGQLQTNVDCTCKCSFSFFIQYPANQLTL